MLGFGKKKAKKGEAASAEAAEAEKPAATEGEGAETEAPKKKGLPVKMIVMVAAALVVVGGGGGGAAFFFLNKSGGAEEQGGGHKPAKKAAGHSGGGGETKAGEVNPNGCTMSGGGESVHFCKLPAILTNTATVDGRPNNLKLQITLELGDEATSDVIGEQMPRLRDLLQTFLRELRPEDLNGSQGDFRLRQEIMQRVNLVIAPAKVEAVLIEEMLQT